MAEREQPPQLSYGPVRFAHWSAARVYGAVGSHRHPQRAVEVRYVSGAVRLRRVQQARVGGLPFWPRRGSVSLIADP